MFWIYTRVPLLWKAPYGLGCMPWHSRSPSQKHVGPPKATHITYVGRLDALGIGVIETQVIIGHHGSLVDFYRGGAYK